MPRLGQNSVPSQKWQFRQDFQDIVHGMLEGMPDDICKHIEVWMSLKAEANEETLTAEPRKTYVVVVNGVLYNSGCLQVATVFAV